jgi:hypothetical protein
VCQHTTYVRELASQTTKQPDGAGHPVHSKKARLAIASDGARRLMERCDRPEEAGAWDAELDAAWNALASLPDDRPREASELVAQLGRLLSARGF